MLPCVFHVVFKSVNESTVPWTRAQVDNLVGGYCKDSCSIPVPCKSSLLDHKLHEYSTLQNNGKWFSKEGELIYILLIITEHLFIIHWPFICSSLVENIFIFVVHFKQNCLHFSFLYVGILYIFQTNLLSVMYLANISFSFWLLCSFASFDKQNFVCLTQSNVLIFIFVLFKNFFPTPRLGREYQVYLL